MGTYVVGDIHGCLDEWLELKNKIEAQDSEAKFILVGDIVDRGPKVYETLQWAMQNITKDGKYQMILGNHEAMKIDWLKQYFEIQQYEENFNLYDMSTDKYDFHYMCLDRNLSDQQLKEILNFFKSLPYYKEFDINTSANRKKHFIIVHGGINYRCLTKNETIRKNCLTAYNKYGDLINVFAYEDKEAMLWNRDSWGYDMLRKSIVVHGHTPTFDEDVIWAGGVPGQIHFINNSINVDCGLVFRNMVGKYSNLGAIRLEDLEEFYVYDVEIDKNDEDDVNNYANYELNQQRKREMFKRKINRKTEISDEEWEKILKSLDLPVTI